MSLHEFVLEIGPNVLSLSRVVVGVGAVAYLLVRWWDATGGKGRLR